MNFRDIGNRVYSVLGAAIVAGAVSVAANAYAGGEDGFEPEDVAGVSCKSSADCGGGFYCLDGSCIECGDVKEEKKPYGTKVECPEGQSNIDGECVPVMETVSSDMTEDDIKAAIDYVPATSAGQLASPTAVCVPVSPTAQNVPATSTGQAVPETRALPSGLRGEEVKCEGECAEESAREPESVADGFKPHFSGAITPRYGLVDSTTIMSGNRVNYPSHMIAMDGGVGYSFPRPETNVTAGVIGGLELEINRGDDDLDGYGEETNATSWRVGGAVGMGKKKGKFSHGAKVSLTYGQESRESTYNPGNLGITMGENAKIVSALVDALFLGYANNEVVAGGGFGAAFDWNVDVNQKTDVSLNGVKLPPIDETDVIGKELNRGQHYNLDLNAGPAIGYKEWILGRVYGGFRKIYNRLKDPEDTGAAETHSWYGGAEAVGSISENVIYGLGGEAGTNHWCVSAGVGNGNIVGGVYYKDDKSDFAGPKMSVKEGGVRLTVQTKPDGVGLLHKLYGVFAGRKH